MRFLVNRLEDETLLLPSHTSCHSSAWRGAEVGCHGMPPARAASQKHCSVLASSSHEQSWVRCGAGRGLFQGLPWLELEYCEGGYF